MLGDFRYNIVDDSFGERNWKVLSLYGGRYQGEIKKEGFFTKEKKNHGKGTIIFKDGSCFEGTCKEGKLTGKGRYIWADGRFYIGYNNENKKEGLGIHISPGGGRCEGEWRNDKNEGTGTKIYDNG